MHTSLLDLHIAGGSLALLSMLVPLVSRKGGIAHRRAGWVFVAGMGTVCVSALVMSVMRVLTDPRPAARQFALLLIYIAILTGAGMWAGMRVLRAKKRTTRGSAADLAMAGLLAGSGLVTAVYGALESQPLFIAFSLIGLLNGSGQIWYWLRRPTDPMHWWFAHMGNMLGSCIAALTAFLLAGARRFGVPADSLIVWLGPTIVGVPAIIIWSGYYRRRFERRSEGRPLERPVATA